MIGQRPSARGLLPFALLLAAAALAGGCFNPFNPLISPNRGVSEPPPVPIDPRSTLLLFQWCYEHRAIEEYRELFTDDYVFVFAETDSAGNAFRDRPWTREDEMTSATNLFVGGGTEPPADRITLDFTNPLQDFPSGITGQNPKWHKEIRAEVNLRVTRGESAIEVRGPGLFYFVRGDSAALPEELIQRGFTQDSTRWYIERWEDETTSTAGAYTARRITTTTTASGAVVEDSQPIPLPPTLQTWGDIKAYYRLVTN